MAIRDTWHRALVYFGLAEDPEHADVAYEPDTGAHEMPKPSRERRQTKVSSLSERRRQRGDDFDDIFSDEGGDPSEADHGRTRSLRPVGNGSSRVHLVNPTSFNDAQEVADRFKQGVPVIINLQATEAELAKRLIDFSSGLTYALDGGMSKVAEKTFLLTPQDVEVSAEERARLIEKGFFNQS